MEVRQARKSENGDEIIAFLGLVRVKCKSVINRFLTAMQFLTLITIPKMESPRVEVLAQSIVWFPVVGFLLGSLLILAHFIFTLIFPSSLVDIFILMTLIFLTGGIHLDGLVDSLDGFYSSTQKDKILPVMKDSRIGSMGALGLTLLLLVKYLALHELSMTSLTVKIYALWLAPVMGRWMMVLAAAKCQYARAEDGLGKIFLEQTQTGAFFKASLIPILVSFLCFQWKALVMIALVFLVTWLLIGYIVKRIGGMTGDTLGAINESIETLVFIIIVAIQSKTSP